MPGPFELPARIWFDVCGPLCSQLDIMKKPLAVGASALALVTLVGACTTEPQRTTPRNRYGYGNTGTQVLQQQQTTQTNLPPLTQTMPDTSTTDSALLSPPTSAAPTPAPTPVTLPTPEISYGIPVPGKPGFVTSPHAPSAGFVDVRGFPPGTEVKDPFTGRIFLVP